MQKYFLGVSMFVYSFSVNALFTQTARSCAAVIKQAQKTSAWSAQEMIIPVLKESGLAVECAKIANNLLRSPEHINWLLSPYDSIDSQVRAILEQRFETGFDLITSMRSEKLKQILGATPPLSVSYAAGAARVELKLTLSDIYRQERAYQEKRMQLAHIKEFGDKNARSTIPEVKAATSYALRLLVATIAETAYRLQDTI